MPLLDTFQAAERTKLARATLAKLRVLCGGPPSVKLGAKVLHDAADFEAWIAAQGKRRSTSAAPAPEAAHAADATRLLLTDRTICPIRADRPYSDMSDVSPQPVRPVRMLFSC